LCHGIEALRHTRYGLNIPLSLHSRPWAKLTTNFVTNMPESTASGYTRILVIVDSMTKIAIYLPCWKDIDYPELARMFFEHVIRKHGVPDNISTPRSNEFTSWFWDSVFSPLSINHHLWTAFHPQTDC
jgi:hypothetical protein